MSKNKIRILKKELDLLVKRHGLENLSHPEIVDISLQIERELQGD